MIEAIISAAAAILVCLISNHFQARRTEAQQEKTISLVLYRLDQLEKKQDLHNNAVTRLYEVERKLGIDEEKLSVANRRIGNLEQFHK